jgi:hypothetical protein
MAESLLGLSDRQLASDPFIGTPHALHSPDGAGSDRRRALTSSLGCRPGRAQRLRLQRPRARHGAARPGLRQTRQSLDAPVINVPSIVVPPAACKIAEHRGREGRIVQPQRIIGPPGTRGLLPRGAAFRPAREHTEDWCVRVGLALVGHECRRCIDAQGLDLPREPPVFSVKVPIRCRAVCLIRPSMPLAGSLLGCGRILDIVA